MDSPDFNPYASPLSCEDRDVSTEFYRIEYRSMTYREIWQITDSLFPFVVLATIKILRLSSRKISISGGTANHSPGYSPA
jgi:hypothetical protein